MGFTPIENGESALSVREKINSLYSSLSIGNNIKLSEETKALYGGIETVDEALKSAKSLISNISDVANSKTRIATGAYSGLSGTSRNIYVGATPKVLIVSACTRVDGDYLNRGMPHNLVIGVYPITSAATHAFVSSSAEYYTTSVAVQWTSTGAIFSSFKTNASPSIFMDDNNLSYSWIAFF